MTKSVTTTRIILKSYGPLDIVGSRSEVFDHLLRVIERQDLYGEFTGLMEGTEYSVAIPIEELEGALIGAEHTREIEDEKEPVKATTQKANLEETHVALD